MAESGCKALSLLLSLFCICDTIPDSGCRSTAALACLTADAALRSSAGRPVCPRAAPSPALLTLALRKWFKAAGDLECMSLAGFISEKCL